MDIELEKVIETVDLIFDPHGEPSVTFYFSDDNRHRYDVLHVLSDPTILEDLGLAKFTVAIYKQLRKWSRQHYQQVYKTPLIYKRLAWTNGIKA